MRNARFWKIFGFAIGLLLLTACSGDDIYRDGGSNSGGYGNSNDYGNSNGYGNYGGYNNGGYYPYGNANYPRDRIYIVNGYNPCNGYVYQGYCYRDKDDYRAAVIWDQNHRNDANWNKKRKDWCRTHDCSRDHDTHGRDDYGRDDYDRDGHGRHDEILDAQGKPVPSQSQPPIRKRVETLRPEPVTRQHENHYEGSNRQPVKYQQPVYRAPEHRQTEQRQQQERIQQQPVVRQQPVRQQPAVQQPEYRQPRSEPVQRVQSQEQKPQRRRSESLGSDSSE